MNDMLFEVPEQLSPRLKWMKENAVYTCYNEYFEEAPWLAMQAEYLQNPTEEEIVQAFCYEHGSNGSLNVGEGKTEQEAITDLAIKLGLKLWNEK